ncbi:MAG: hypothetical protein LC122_12800 [Chitinophagales bacterium]|nr:hypothetical protein [Chitinophagales bacterium]
MEDIKLVNLLGSSLEDAFLDFDFSEIQEILETLKDISPIDIAHVELLQQKALRGADICSEYLGKIYKTVSYLESKVSVEKNRASLEYNPENVKVTMEMRKWAGESSSIVEELQIKLAKAKGSKALLEKKYDILIKSHHHWKDIASGLKKSY